jgi:hypothetical protein
MVILWSQQVQKMARCIVAGRVLKSKRRWWRANRFILLVVQTLTIAESLSAVQEEA